MAKSPWQGAFGIFRQVIAICAAVLLIYQPAAWPATPAAVGRIATNGNAELNGANAVTGATVFSGDRIVTSRDSTASLALTGGRRVVLVGPGAMQVKPGGGELTAVLVRGKLAILSPASAPIIVEASGTRIIPGKEGGVYVVAVNGNDLEVTAHKGSAEVEAANRTVEISEGKTLRATLQPDQGPPSAGGHSSLAVVAIVLALALGGTALGIAIHNLTRGCKTVSPSSIGCEID